MNRKATPCEHSDGYLGQWLTREERVEFESHLADCPGCRRIVGENERLDRLLIRANAALLPVPAGLLDQIDARLRRARRRNILAWTGGLAAACILLGTLAISFFNPHAPDKERMRSPVLTQRSKPTEPKPDLRSLVQVTVENPSDVIAVPQKTESPSVTIIWLYPTINAAQEPGSAPSELSQSQERNGI